MSRAEEKRCFIASIGFSSDDRDNSNGPLGAINLDRYNSEIDG